MESKRTKFWLNIFEGFMIAVLLSLLAYAVYWIDRTTTTDDKVGMVSTSLVRLA